MNTELSVLTLDSHSSMLSLVAIKVNFKQISMYIGEHCSAESAL